MQWTQHQLWKLFRTTVICHFNFHKSHHISICHPKRTIETRNPQHIFINAISHHSPLLWSITFPLETHGPTHDSHVSRKLKFVVNSVEFRLVLFLPKWPCFSPIFHCDHTKSSCWRWGIRTDAIRNSHTFVYTNTLNWRNSCPFFFHFIPSTVLIKIEITQTKFSN